MLYCFESFVKEVQASSSSPKDIFLVGNYPLSFPNNTLANELMRIITNVIPHRKVNIHECHDHALKIANLVCLGMKGSRGLIGVREGLEFVFNQGSENDISALILDIPSDSNTLHAIRTINDDDRQWLIKHFINSNDPAFQDKPICYSTDTHGTYSIRRVFHLQTLLAAFKCSNNEVFNEKYSKDFLDEYLKNFRYAIEHPFTPTPRLLLNYDNNPGADDNLAAFANVKKLK